MIKGDFLGFTFNGVHSSELGIFRTSDGSRYTENLLPTIQDKTTPIPGADGTYFYGSYFTQRTFNLSIAFDNMTDSQFRRMKELFSDKKLHDLIFDELPYKVYKVKTTGAPNLKFVCFDAPLDLDTQVWDREPAPLYEQTLRKSTGRIYKGEGQLSFVAYTPYARSRFKYEEEYKVKEIPEWGPYDKNNPSSVYDNKLEWIEASRMINRNTFQIILKDGTSISAGEFLDKARPSGIFVYNAGDLSTPFYLYFLCNKFEGGEIRLTDKDNKQYSIFLDAFNLNGDDKGFRINTKLHLIEGIDASGNPTGTIFNKYISGGDFFELPPSDDKVFDFLLFLREGDGFSEVKEDKESPTCWIEYDYLYY